MLSIETPNKTYKPIAGIYVIAAPTVDTANNKYGQIIKYRHRINDYYTKEFKASDMLHIYHNKRTGITIGTPPLEAVKDDLYALRTIEQCAETMIYRNASPFIHVKVGEKDSPARILSDGTSEIDIYSSIIDNMFEYGGVATPHRVNIDLKGAESQALRLESYLTHFQNRVLAGMCVSSVDLAIGEFNQMIDNIQGLKTYFECENTRNSENLLDTIRSIKQLIDGLNLLSSIIYALAKKEVRGICKSTKALKQITNNSLTEDDLLLKDFLKDVYQKEVEIISTNPDNIEILVYDKPVYYSLPKIDLLDCSIDEFIKNHTLDAIMDIATQDVLQEDGQERLIVDNSPWESFTFTNILPTVTPELNLITELLYNKPTVNPEVVNTQTNTNSNTFNISPEFKKPELLDNDIKCKNIQDVLNVLETLKGL